MPKKNNSSSNSNSNKSMPSPLKDKTLESIVQLIKDKKASKVIVMTGAGISTGAGIPDFRTKGTGLYDNLQKFNLPYPEAIFDIDFFEEKPEPFYALAKEIYPGKFYPTKTHYFIRLLHEKGLLLRNFTQNIDTLERLTGLDHGMIVEAHGSFATASCIGCHKHAEEEVVRERVIQAKVARCEDCDGLIKPDITFFGESLPRRFFDRLDDFEEADLLIVIGTSLKVQPFASLIDDVEDHVPRLLINKELAGASNSAKSGFDFKWKHKRRDVAHLDDCDAGIEKMADLLGWKDELHEMFRKGNEKLKAQWSAEEALLAVKNEEETTEEAPAEEKEDKEIEALAEELEKRLKVPADRREGEERVKEEVKKKTPKM
ncbi:DHS-like NAD/FAD-binding domain-containing protein [Zychaea mexicana]|uniref:DHS-like NAD/FAD-binding domain-containing protein n=1 Tax=Zychaea mexicana TaxID=64656 RepID=UPI0022FDE90F|nr:DHS-like NAD/FAD-binding domain-containing protein [Zychaea mexicana]KAI9489935.1 DHS-like NAD/FAD-binding domain-containing protein [Zychaea mexicana]